MQRTAGDSPLVGTVKGDSVRFSYNIKYGDYELALIISAKFTGGTVVKGTVDFAGQVQEAFEAFEAFETFEAWKVSAVGGIEKLEGARPPNFSDSCSAPSFFSANSLSDATASVPTPVIAPALGSRCCASHHHPQHPSLRSIDNRRTPQNAV